MLKRFALVVLGALAVPQVAGAVAACPDRTPAAITAAAADSVKCQDTIAKAGAKFLKTKLKKLAKCKLTQPAGSCPTTTDTLKIEKVAASAAAKIAKKCGDAGARAVHLLLRRQRARPISGCVLSQHNVVSDLIIADSGATAGGNYPLARGVQVPSGRVRQGSTSVAQFLPAALKRRKC
jgi:hypothetical protein